MMSGRTNPDFAGGWGVSLARFPSRAHFYNQLFEDGAVSLCGSHEHRHIRNRDGSIFAGMADPGDWTRCRRCEKMLTPAIEAATAGLSKVRSKFLAIVADAVCPNCETVHEPGYGCPATPD